MIGKAQPSEPDKEKDTVVDVAVAPVLIGDLDEMKAGLALFPVFRKPPGSEPRLLK